MLTQLFRLLFGGYLAGLDQYHYNDMESAWTVFAIYVIIGIFTTLFLLGKRKSGLLGLIAHYMIAYRSVGVGWIEKETEKILQDSS